GFECAAGANARPPSASDQRTLDELRGVFGKTIESATEDAHHWELARRVAESGVLLGWNKTRVAEQLGRGMTCGTWQQRPGEDADDRWCYEVGQLPPHTTGGTPVMILDFDEKGVCTSSRAIRTQ
ncbi:MAG: hypothetical protein ABW061_22310, partial [Polyangiaceae bacterium]